MCEIPIFVFLKKIHDLRNGQPIKYFVPVTLILSWLIKILETFQHVEISLLLHGYISFVVWLKFANF